MLGDAHVIASLLRLNAAIPGVVGGRSDRQLLEVHRWIREHLGSLLLPLLNLQFGEVVLQLLVLGLRLAHKILLACEEVVSRVVDYLLASHEGVRSHRA